MSVLVGGTAASQLLLILAAPLLTRLYTPEDFGILAVYTSLLTLIGAVSSLRYEIAIPLPQDDDEAANVAILSLALIAFVTATTAAASLVFGYKIAHALGVPPLANWMWLLPVGVFLSGVFSVLNYWGIRSKSFTVIAATRLRQTLGTLAVQLAGFKVGGMGLLGGQVVGQGIGVASLLLSRAKRLPARQVSRRGLLSAAHRYRRFPIFTTWASLLNVGGTQLAPLLFASFFGASTAGVYILAHRVLALPTSIVGEAIQNVFFSGASAAHRADELSAQIERLLDLLAQISLPILMIIAIAGPRLFTITFGEEWGIAGEFARWMTPWLFMQFCTSPLTLVFATIEKQQVGLLMQAQLFCVRTVMILIGAAYGDLRLSVILFSLGSAVSYLIFLLAILRASGTSTVVVVRSLWRSVGVSLLLASPLLLTNPDTSTPLVFFASLCLVAILIMVRYVALARSHLK